MALRNDKPRVWLEWNDVAHISLFNLLPIALIAVVLNWQIALLLLGWCCWDLGWHQFQHHRSRRHIHAPLRLIGVGVVTYSIYLLYVAQHAHVHLPVGD